MCSSGAISTLINSQVRLQQIFEIFQTILKWKGLWTNFFYENKYPIAFHSIDLKREHLLIALNKLIKPLSLMFLVLFLCELSRTKKKELWKFDSERVTSWKPCNKRAEHFKLVWKIQTMKICGEHRIVDYRRKTISTCFACLTRWKALFKWLRHE